MGLLAAWRARRDDRPRVAGEPSRASHPSPADGRVLELRVHGVNNTSPHGMLDLPESSVERVLGDEFAGFWRPKKDATKDVDPDERGWVPPQITREAYSWGGLARTSPLGAGGSKISAFTGAVGRVSWILLMPLGLVNVAYWARPIDGVSESGLRARWSKSPGGWVVRWFALLLTAFILATAAEVSSDMVGSQCYYGNSKVCTKIPGWFDVLAKLTPSTRLLVTALFPLLVLGVFLLITSISRSRYERTVADFPPRDEEGDPAPVGSGAEANPTPLGRSGFWQGDKRISRLIKLHLAVGLTVISWMIAWPAAAGSGDDCGTFGALRTEVCRQQIGDQSNSTGWVFVGLAAGSVVILILVLLLAVIDHRDVPFDRAEDDEDDRSRAATVDRRLNAAAVVLVALAVLQWVAVYAVMLIRPPDLLDGRPLLGVSVLPSMIVAALLCLTLAAFFIRFRGALVVFVVLAACVAVEISLSVGDNSDLGWAFAAVIGGVTLLIIAARWPMTRDRTGKAKAHVAWRGAGPGIFLALALFAQCAISALVVLVVGDWLNGPLGASKLIGVPVQEPPAKPTCALTCPVPIRDLRASDAYVLVGVGVVIALVLFLLLVGKVLMLTRGECPPDGGTFDGGEDPQAPETAPNKTSRRDLRRARRNAAIAHRAEGLVGLLAAFALVTLAAVVAVSMHGAVDWESDEWALQTVRKVSDFSTWGLAAIGLAVLGSLIGGSATGNKRPLGLFWDLVCFLPRAAHPFGPPCYAERAVPELSSRVSWWLDQRETKTGKKRGGDHVVVSAHSLGCVITVAALLMRRPSGKENAGDVRLLTYGCQLRPFFSRIFPELLGPTVLGTPAITAPHVRGKNPWRDEQNMRASLDHTQPLPTVLHGGGHNARAQWMNMWHWTDYLGFPIASWHNIADGPDRRAAETDPTSYLVEVLTHSQYFRTKEYKDALEVLSR